MLFIAGDMKDKDIKDILNNYEKDLDNTMNKHMTEKERQAYELRKRLEERRKRREAELKEKHRQQVRNVGNVEKQNLKRNTDNR